MTSLWGCPLTLGRQLACVPTCPVAPGAGFGTQAPTCPPPLGEGESEGEGQGLAVLRDADLRTHLCQRALSTER
jgi:hypothetical protein